MNLMTLGICGVGQQIQLDHCARADGNLAWILLAFLSAVCPIPYSTSPAAGFIHYGIVLLVYRFKIFLLGLTRYWSWSCESKNKPGADDFVAETHPGGGAADRGRPIFVRLRRGVVFFEHS